MHTAKQQTSRHHAKPGIPAQADSAAYRYMRSGLRERNEPPPLRRAPMLMTTRSTKHACRPGITSCRNPASRHPGTADAAHRHARAGLRERNGPKPTRGARATRPATSQHRVGRRRRGSDERRRTLLLRKSFWTRSSNGSSDIVTFVAQKVSTTLT